MHISPANVSLTSFTVFLVHVLQVRLTAMSGDANLYMTAGYATQLPGPGQGKSTWSSAQSGDDAITVLSSDKDYCSGCDYVIGVHSPVSVGILSVYVCTCARLY